MLPTGVLYGKDKTLTMQATGQMNNAAEFRRLIIAYRNGAAVRLGDVANVLDDIQNNKSVSWYDDERSVNLMVQRQPGTNTVEVATRVKEALAEIEKGLPPTLKVHVQYDRSVSIENAVADVKLSLLVALVLVVAVIFIFLRSAVATLIPSLTLPLAIIGTFSVMYALDFSIDNLSLMALTLAVGFIVDDAIVMLENIVRHIEMGKPPMQAALEGSRGSRVHRALDVSVALGGVHSADVHGRHHRPAVPRVRDHDQRVGARLGLRRADAHADAVQPPAQAARDSDEKHGRLFNFTERAVQRRARAATSAASAG